DLFTRRRARHVDHGDEIAMQRGGVCRCPRCEQEHEVSVFTDGMVWQQRQTDQAACERQQQLEVSPSGSIRERHLETIVAAGDLNLVSRRVGIAETRGTVDLHPEAARRTPTIAIAEVAEPPRVPRALEYLRVLQGDLARLARGDGEHARTN